MFKKNTSPIYLDHFLLANDLCSVRMMTNNPNEYHQVKIHRKKKLNPDNAGMILMLINLFEIKRIVEFRCSFNNSTT
jgi:hypothetical protein